MSGIEIVGLVLGAIPVAVGVFQTVVEVARGDVQETVRRLMWQLKSTQVVYFCELESLIRRCCPRHGVSRPQSGDPPALDFTGRTAQNEMQKILTLLGTLEVQTQLDAYLRSNLRLQAFQENINEFMRCLAEVFWAFRKLLPKSVRDQITPTDHLAIMKCLVQNKNTLSQLQLANRIAFRIRIYKNKASIQETINHLVQLENHLSKVLSHNDTTSETNADSSAVAIADYFQQKRSRAMQLYSEVTRLFQGDCHKSHVIRLFLDEYRAYSTGYDNPYFRVALVCLDESDSRLLLHEGNIWVQERPSFAYDMSVGMGCANEISDLCSHLKLSKQRQVPLALSLSEKGKLMPSAVSSHQQTLSCLDKLQDPEDEITFSDIIAKWYKLSLRSKGMLHRIDRIRIALKIAWSLLQLSSTEWAVRLSSADEIRFKTFCDGSSGSESGTNVDAGSPFISCDSATRVVLASQASSVNDASFALENLGILLLELYHRQSAVVWAANNPETNTNERSIFGPMIDLKVAKRWVESVEYDMHAGYFAAIKFCLEEASVPSSTWSNPQFCLEFLKRVVQPLNNICKNLL